MKIKFKGGNVWNGEHLLIGHDYTYEERKNGSIYIYDELDKRDYTYIPLYLTPNEYKKFFEKI